MTEQELKKANLKEIIRQYSKAGNYIEAIPYMERYVDVIKEEYGEDSERYVTVINDLGGMYRNIGNFDKTVEIFTKALDAIENKLGLGNRSEQYATVSVNLACMYRFTKEFEKAEKMFLNAIEIYEENEEIQNILNSSSKCKSEIEKIQDNKNNPKELIRKSTLYANASNNLGTLYQDMDRLEEAVECHNKSLELLRNTNNYEYIAITLNNLVNPLLKLKKLQEAHDLAKASLEIFEKHLTKQHPFYLTALNNLGAIYFYAGYPEKAMELFKNVEEYLKNTFGENSPQYKSCLKNIEETEKIIENRKNKEEGNE